MPPFRPTAPSFLQLFALPLTRQSKGATPLFYLHAKKPPASAVDKSQLSYITRATDMAANQWEKLGKADEGTYKRRIYLAGDKFMDRIEFEEWALKAIDPALAPKPWTSIAAGADGVEQEKANREGEVDLLYPPSLLAPDALLESLKSQLAHREPHHKSAMWKCLVGAPLTAPFALIPVIPNLPLFYVLWRAWSHWKAWKASSYLSTLLASSPPQLKLTSSSELDSIYAAGGGAGGEGLLLNKEMVEKLVKTWDMQEEERHELLRGVAQAEERLKRETNKNEEEKTKA